MTPQALADLNSLGGVVDSTPTHRDRSRAKHSRCGDMPASADSIPGRKGWARSATVNAYVSPSTTERGGTAGYR